MLNEDLENFFKIKKVLGNGRFATVYLVESLYDDTEYILK